MTHTWRFFRSSGFDQVIIDSVDDLQQLASLDKKLWAALACPSKGLELDARTLSYIDADSDGRIRVPELLAAVEWSLARLSTPEVLFSGNGLVLAAINREQSDGAKIFAAAKQLLSRLGKKEADSVSVADTDDLSKMFPPSQANGDGLIPAALAIDPDVAQAINDIIATLGGETDRSGEAAISADKIKQFFADLKTLAAWEVTLAEQPDLQPLGDKTASAFEALLAVESKIEDYFVRTQLASFDDKATVSLNSSESQFVALGSQLLSLDSIDTKSLPLAKISANQPLVLTHGINPAWQQAMQQFCQQCLAEDVTELNLEQWLQLKAQFIPYKTWLSQKPALSVATLDAARRAALVNSLLEQALLALVDEDLAVADAANALVDLDKLVRYQANLIKLVNNFVSFSDFYTRKEKAIFQAGTLFMDGRSCDLTIQVNDMGKHAKMAGLSNAYLVYCECTRKDSNDKMTIVAAITAGEVGNLMVGRNGVFYDRAGKDWDATIVKIIENPISVREAFWTPYRRLGRMISNQMQKMAAEQDKAIEAKTAEQVTSGSAKLQEAAKAAPDAPKAAPAPFDVAKFAGIFAAIGLAVGALGTALAAIVSGFLALEWWKSRLRFWACC
ncbi:MAG: hypothetical protein H6996_11210 [Moraxellaceae bacterium]|nr:hypothetical protein [Moraxellaceae bacterium]MCP5175937.1 hypothetical protein [Moraxellaceae bacterium]